MQAAMLWFDVGIKRYTTDIILNPILQSCGLMQESKDIQHGNKIMYDNFGCGLMQESKDIQHNETKPSDPIVVV